MPHASQALGQALLPVAATAIAILVLAAAIYLIRSWLRDNDGPAASCHELLGEYQELNRQGELSDEEFRIIKSRMASRIGRMSDSMRSSDGKG
jgi:hypothetical protein